MTEAPRSGGTPAARLAQAEERLSRELALMATLETDDSAPSLAEDVRLLLGHAKQLGAEVASLREAYKQISDYGWYYDGKVTFTVNCESKAGAQQLRALIGALAPGRELDRKHPQ